MCDTCHKASQSARKSTFFLRGRTQLTDFSQIPQNPPRMLPVHDVIHILLVTFSIWDFYFDICERHILTARVSTSAFNKENLPSCGLVPCNGYRRRKWTQRHELKSWTRLIAFHIPLIPLGKV